MIVVVSEPFNYALPVVGEHQVFGNERHPAAADPADSCIFEIRWVYQLIAYVRSGRTK